jgi:hypothetical protein
MSACCVCVCACVCVCVCVCVWRKDKAEGEELVEEALEVVVVEERSEIRKRPQHYSDVGGDRLIHVCVH